MLKRPPTYTVLPSGDVAMAETRRLTDGEKPATTLPVVSVKSAATLVWVDPPTVVKSPARYSLVPFTHRS